MVPGVRIWVAVRLLQGEQKQIHFKGLEPSVRLADLGRGRGHGSIAMARDQFFVVLHEGQWKIKHNGQHSRPYATQAEAIRSAIDQAHSIHKEGGLSQVLVEDLQFREEWTYGKDPYPPPG
jgi:uncharacterized protein DUF2188